MQELQRGDIVRIKGTGMSLVVDSNQGDQVVCVRTTTMTNPSEWEKIEIRKSRSKGVKIGDKKLTPYEIKMLLDDQVQTLQSFHRKGSEEHHRLETCIVEHFDELGATEVRARQQLILLLMEAKP